MNIMNQSLLHNVKFVYFDCDACLADVFFVLYCESHIQVCVCINAAHLSIFILPSYCFHFVEVRYVLSVLLSGESAHRKRERKKNNNTCGNIIFYIFERSRACVLIDRRRTMWFCSHSVRYTLFIGFFNTYAQWCFDITNTNSIINSKQIVSIIFICCALLFFDSRLTRDSN